MSWSTALTDLRTKLSDNSTDRLRAFKKVFGDLNGTNKNFKTFEFRRVTDFTDGSSPLGVYLNNTLIASSGFSYDDPDTGYFGLSAAPVDGDILNATYYVQYFNDDELTGFLRLASNFLAAGDDYSLIPGGLQNGALCYAAAEGYQKLALRFADTMSDTYRLEDLPDVDRNKIVEGFKKSSDESRKQAITFRNDYYENRQGEALAPLFGRNNGRVFDVPPNR